MTLFRRIRQWLKTLPYKDPVKRRLSGILQLIFLSLIGVALFTLVLLLFFYGAQGLTITTMIPNLVFSLIMAAGLVLLRRGTFNAAVWILIITVVLGQSLSFLVGGFRNTQEAKLLSMVPLTLAGLVLNRRALLITLILTLALAGVIAAVQNTLYPGSVASFLGFALLLALIGLVLDRFGDAFRSALADAQEREYALKWEVEARKLSEQSLAQQREQYRVTLASIGDAVIATDTQGRVTFVNPIAESLTGWQGTAAIGEPINRVYPIISETTQEPADNPIQQVLRAGAIVGMQNHTALVSRDQVLIPITHNGAPIRSEDGSLIGAILVFRDVTEERRAEAELKESEARFRSMSDSAPVLIWMADTDARCTFVNRQWLDFTGQTLDQVLGDGWLSSIHPDDRERCVAAYRAAFEKRQPLSLEYRLHRYDGVYCWILARSIPRLLSSGALAGYIGSCMDISTRVEAEERAHLLQTLTDSLSSALTIDEVVDVFIDVGFMLLGAPVGLVGLIDEYGKVEIVGQHGTANAATGESLPLATAAVRLLTQIAQTHTASWIENARLHPEWIDCFTPVPVQSVVGLPLMVDQHPVGSMILGFADRQPLDSKQQAFLRTFAHQCAQALERAQLHRQAQQAAALAERQRLARELHDAVSQTLFSATSLAEGLPAMWEKDPARGREILQNVITLNRGAMAEMRTLLLELRPESILRTPLSNLLMQLVNAARARKGIAGDLSIVGSDDGLNSAIHLALYRIAQESVNNILKHSQATELSLKLHIQPEGIDLEITDNGRGFEVEQRIKGMGLTNIRERATFSGGTVDIISAPGNGTRIAARWKLPLSDESIGASTDAAS
ncbi:MAG: PAS domain S-box protein [Anaerolineae bacterium]